MAQGVITAGESAFSLAGAKQFPRMANRVGAGSAGIGDQRDRAAKTEGISEIKRLSLCLIMSDARCLVFVKTRLRGGLAKIAFPKAHSATGRAKNDREILGRSPLGLMPCFVCGEEQHFCGAIGALQMPSTKQCVGHFRQGGFCGRLHALARNIKQGDRAESRFAETKTFRIFFPADAERRDDSRTGDNHPVCRVCLVVGRKKHAFIMR